MCIRDRMKVEHRNLQSRRSPFAGIQSEEELPFQEQLDKILDKIKEKGYEKLTSEEKAFLKKASEKK